MFWVLKMVRDNIESMQIKFSSAVYFSPCMLSNIDHSVVVVFSKLAFFQKIFQEYCQNVEQFWSSSGQATKL